MMQSVAYQPREVMPAPVVEIIPATIQNTIKVTERKNLRVAAYCRVSTDHEEQQTSYKTQIEYYIKIPFCTQRTKSSGSGETP